ncbi:MAG: SpoIID/LytB domain-containing protein [Polyangia bacterium]|jgi:SpoIID/LytB domain protein|nr:SpoIID/LytB domain-containing protein [Polyangia bacterium]
MPRTPALLLASIVLACLDQPLAGAAPGEEEARALYANRFSFDRRGVPLISVRIMEGQSRVSLVAPGGLRMQPYGTDSTHVAGASQWTVTLTSGVGARARHWVVVDRIPGALDEAERRKALALWKSRGLSDPRTMEVGALFAVGGRVVDHRVTLVVTDPEQSQAAAEAKSRQLAAKLGRPTTLHRELLRRPTGTLTAQAPGTGLQIVSQDVLWFSPLEDGQLTVKRVEFGRGYRWHGFKDRRYLGRVYVTVDRKGQLAVVNEVPADRLLCGLVPAEMYTSAPLDALKAQAVAARGQLLAKIGTRHTTDPYLICSSQHCQVYSGAGHEHPRSTKAVEETRGMILVDQQGRLADTVYSANAGGHTEHNEHVWGTPPNPNLRGRLDVSPEDARKLTPFARGISEQSVRKWILASPPAWSNRSTLGVLGRFRWSVRLDQAEMDRLVRARFGAQVKRVRRIEVLSRGVSGRATALRIHVEEPRGEARHDVHGELAIRRLLGNLKSSMFVVEHQRGAVGRMEFVFRGGGWGHGVGMCQTGAIGMAEASHDFRGILGHYYPQTRLVKLY